MRLFRLFSGPDAQKLEQQADALFDARSWGRAKLAYEGVLDKLQKQPDANALALARVGDKHRRAIEALAREHQQTAEGYLEGGHFKEAGDLLHLAVSLTVDEAFRQELERRIAQVAEWEASQKAAGVTFGLHDDHADAGFFEADDEQGDEQDYFMALCGPLPEEARRAYLSYGEPFKTGYIALNQGDFETAAAFLESAMDQLSETDSYIPLELAAAYLHLGRLDEAHHLLDSFIGGHPDVLPAYQLLCEIYWEQKAYARANALLDALSPDLSRSVAVFQLKGETLHQEGRFGEAVAHYEGVMKTHGWSDAVALALAKAYQGADRPDKARSLYKTILAQCASCNNRIDPVVKHNYAELSFAAGQTTSDILETYLSLVRELPDNAAHYYHRASRIYAARGDEAEAARFEAFARRAEQAIVKGS